MKRFQSLLLVLGALSASSCFYHDDDDDDDDFTIVSSSAEIEPNDQSASPHFLGVLRHFEEMRVTGDADATTDEFDGFAISLTKESEIEFELSFDDVAGELDVWVYDPAVDDIALFFEDDFSPDRGSFEVHTPVLDFQIIVRAFSGASPYTLSVRARPLPLHFHSTATEADTDPVEPPTGVTPSLVPNDVERGLAPEERARARNAYVGAPVASAAPNGPAARVGTLVTVDEDGRVRTAPLLEVEPGVLTVDGR